MKRLIIDPNDNEQNIKNNNEISVFKSIHHPNLIQYIESFIHKDKLCIIMEYADGGDLSKVVQKHKDSKEYIKENIIWGYFIQLFQGLKYIHSKKIIHRDIKCQNIFLTKDNKVKLGDFGISKILKNTFDYCKTSLGTPYFLSPEICSGKKYNYKTDVWMIGCVLYELATLTKPFEGDNLQVLMINILKKDIKEIPRGYSNDLKFLIRELLTKDQNLRPSLDKISNYDFIQKLIKKYQDQIDEEEDEDNEVINPDDDEINTASSKEFFELKYEKIESVIKESEEEYSDNKSNNLMLKNGKDNKNAKNLLIHVKKKRTSSCNEYELNKQINAEAKAKYDENGKDQCIKSICSYANSSSTSNPYQKKHYRHNSMILGNQKKSIDNNAKSAKVKDKVITNHRPYNSCYNNNILTNCVFVKSTPCLQKKTQSKYPFLKHTPKKYLISFETDSPELANFTFEEKVNN